MTEKNQSTETNQRAIRKEVVGLVVSDKMQKTITVAVARRVMHPKYKKFINRTSKFKAHDETEQAGMGDKVMIYETAPMSKTKRWKLGKILEVAIDVSTETAATTTKSKKTKKVS